MAKIKTRRANGTLAVSVVPSLDHTEEVAVQMSESETLRIHAPNGGYLFSLAFTPQGIVRYQDAMFRDGPRGQRLNVQRIAP